jgi:hypothetical protein
MIAVTLSGRSDTLHVLFDSGCEINVLSQRVAQRLGLDPDQKHSGVSGWRKEMTLLPTITVPELRVGTLSVPYPKFYLQDLAGFTCRGVPVDGIIGYTLLKNYVVELDFTHGQMSLYRSGNFHYPPGGTLLKLGMNYRTPTVESVLQTAHGARFTGVYHVVTGGNFGLLLNADYVKTHQLSGQLPAQGMVTREDLLEPVTFQQLRVPAFTVGSRTFRQVDALYSPLVNDGAPDREIAGAIGAAIWQQYTLYFNLPAKALYVMEASAGVSVVTE